MPHSPLSPLKNYHSSSTNLLMTNFPPPFPTFPSLSIQLPFSPPLTNLNLPSVDQIISILKATSSTSSLYPLPLTILNQIINTVETPLHQIICSSLSYGSVHPDIKKAVITPILKKHNLDSLPHFNYLPISNLSIHSKILERVISSQLITYLTTNNIPNIFQSTYLPHKSTESALTLITSDLLSGINIYRGCILVLLDMFSAFDTLDHNVLIQ